MSYKYANCFSLKAVHITDLAAWCSITFWFIESNPLWYAKHLFLLLGAVLRSGLSNQILYGMLSISF